MERVKAKSMGYARHQELGGDKGRMYDGVIVGILEWSCPFCGKNETYGDHTMQNVFKQTCSCGKEYLVEYWHENDTGN